MQLVDRAEAVTLTDHRPVLHYILGVTSSPYYTPVLPIMQ